MNPMPRALQICLSPSWGGLEMVCYEIAKDPAFNVVMNVTLRDSILEKKFKEENIPFQILKMKKEFTPGAISNLRKLIKENQIELVVVQRLRDLLGLRLALWGMNQVKVVGFSHTFVSYNKKDPLHAWLYQRMSTLITLTNLQKENLLKHLPVKESQLVIIPNAVDTEIVHPNKKSDTIRKEFSMSSNDILIGLVGRLDKAKGQHLLLEAAKNLKQSGIENFKIILIGEETRHEPGTLQKLKDYVETQGLKDQVIFTGFRSDIDRIAASLDVMVMASDGETFGRVVIEGMAAGVPVIATDAGGVPDIIDDGITGLLFPPKDAEKLSKALMKMINDVSLRNQIGLNGRAKAQKVYDSKVVNKQLQDVFRKA